MEGERVRFAGTRRISNRPRPLTLLATPCTALPLGPINAAYLHTAMEAAAAAL